MSQLPETIEIDGDVYLTRDLPEGVDQLIVMNQRVIYQVQELKMDLMAREMSAQQIGMLIKAKMKQATPISRAKNSGEENADADAGED